MNRARPDALAIRMTLALRDPRSGNIRRRRTARSDPEVRHRDPARGHRHRARGTGLRDQRLGRSRPSLRRRAIGPASRHRRRRAAARYRARHPEPREPAAQPGERERRARLPRPRLQPGLRRSGESRLSHAVHVQQPADPGRHFAHVRGAERRPPEVQERHRRMEDARGQPARGRPRFAPRGHLVRQERRQSQRRHDRVRPRRLPVSRARQRRQLERRGPQSHRAGRQCPEPVDPARQDDPHRPRGSRPHRGQRGYRQRERRVPDPDVQSVPGGRAGERGLRARLPQSVPLQLRFAVRGSHRRGRRAADHRGDQTGRARRRLWLGGRGRGLPFRSLHRAGDRALARQPGRADLSDQRGRWARCSTTTATASPSTAGPCIAATTSPNRLASKSSGISRSATCRRGWMAGCSTRIS